jgi:hypothetical protein
MKKKVLFAAAAAALIALNVFSFSSRAIVPTPGPDNIKFNPYQSMSYCMNHALRHSCTAKPTSIRCQIACDGSTVIPVPTDPTLVDM